MTTHTQLPGYANEQLAQLSESQLIELMIRDADRVPRNVIDACARRGEPMQTALGVLLSRETDWQQDDHHDGKFWLRLHTAMILGLMQGNAAGKLLIDLLLRIEIEQDDATQDWLAGCWPALFLNKPNETIQRLRSLAENRQYGLSVRAASFEARIAWLHATDTQAFETALTWLADLAMDERSDWYFRLLCASILIDFPRAQFRSLLNRLAAEQQPGDVFFTKNELDDAYADMTDAPDWVQFSDPWSFYSAEAIEERQVRAHDEEEAWDEDETSVSGLDFAAADHGCIDPYARETSKVGRNDPCPCGSGKKYKKCCLANQAL